MTANKRGRTFLNGLACFILAVLGVLAFSTTVTVSGFSEHSNVTIADNTLLWSVLCLLLTAAYFRLKLFPANRDGLAIGILALLFGFLNVIGQSLFHLDSWDFLFGNLYQFLLGSMCALGYAGVFYAAGTWLFSVLDRGALLADREDTPEKCRLLRVFSEHPALCSAAVMALCYLVWLLIYYPGCTNNDINYQLAQFFGAEKWTNSHPVLSTAIMGVCMAAGKLVGSDNLGMFLYMLLQAAAFCCAFSAIILEMKRLKTALWLQLAALAFFALLPVWGAYAVQGMKDGLFAAVFAYFVLCLFRVCIAGRADALTKGDFIRFGVAAFLTCMLRSAMLFLMLPVLALAVLFAVKGRARLRLGIAAGAAALLCVCTVYALLPALGVIKTNRAESLSIPFQQTARVVRDHADSISPEERAAIDAVLDFNTIGEVYMPVLSDPVKDTYKQRDLPTENEALAAYKAVWRSMFKRYPATYLQATLANSFGYYCFTPSIQTQNGQTAMCFTLYAGDANGVTQTEVYSIKAPGATKQLRTLFKTGAYLLDAAPGVNLLYACAFYFWGTLLLACYMLRRRQGRIALSALPVVLLMLGCIGSSVNDCFRYEAPIAAAFPLVLLAAALAAKNAVGCGKGITRD